MIELPVQRQKPKTFNPRLLILYGKCKSGKSTLMAALENNLIIDLEDGYSALEALVVQARTTQDLGEIANAIKAKITTDAEGNKVYPYKYITIDNATRLEEICMSLAISMYKQTPMGKTFQGNDLRILPQGAGFMYIREAVKKVINTFRGLSETLILIAHVKDRQIQKNGEEMWEMSVDLSGKLGDILCGEADAIGYVYRSKNETHISFEGGDNVLKEARPLHLRGKNLIVATSDENNNIHVDLSQLFPDGKTATT